jgi:HK97 family phage major capsid protein
MKTHTPDLGGLQRRTADEISVSRNLVTRYGRDYDLSELVISRMQHPPRPVDQRKLAAVNDLNETLRQRCGQPATGTWVPLQALSRDLTTANASALVTGTLKPTHTDSLLPSSAVMGAATVISGLSGSTVGLTVTDPAADASDGWVGENAPAPQREPGFVRRLLEPKTLTVAVQVSRRLLQQAGVDVGQLLTAELSARLGWVIDRAALLGSGPNQPLGLLNDTDLTVVAAGANGAAPIWQHLVELEHQVRTKSMGNTQQPAWLMSPALAKKMRLTQRVSGQNGFLYEGADLLGYPVRVSPNVPDTLSKGTSSGVCSALIFGDISEIVIGFWGPAAVDLLIDDYTLRKDGLVRIVARAEVGILPRRIGAFAAFKDLLAA